MSTCLDVLTNALLEIGVYQSSETISAADSAFCMARLNRMLDSWTTQGRYIFTTSIAQYTLPPKIFYTIGQGTPTADIVAPRPGGSGTGNGIEYANIILNSSSTPIRQPLDVISDQEWSMIRAYQIGVSLPTKLYNDGAYPNSSLYLWGYPTVTTILELFTRQQLTQFAALTDAFSFPPGYEDAVTLSLAELLCGPFGRQRTPELISDAARSRAAIGALNSEPRLLITADSGLAVNDSKRSNWNWITGNF
jgi:hypothetical protein